MKHKKLLARQLGEPLSSKHWQFLKDLLRFAWNDMAYNHPQELSCDQVDKDIDLFKRAETLAAYYVAQPANRSFNDENFKGVRHAKSQ